MSCDTAAPYAPRDVINAPAIKRTIENRSRERGDVPEVTAWLLNHYYRHVVGNLVAAAPAVQAVQSVERARLLLHPAPVSEWALARLSQTQGDTKFSDPMQNNATGIATTGGLWWIDPQSELLLATEQRLLEFLGSRVGTSLEGKLMRINCPQALARWEAEHAAFHAMAAAGRRTSNPDAVATVWQGQHGTFVELLPTHSALRAEMAYESQMMQHCLGQFSNRRALTGGYGESHAAKCEAGRLRVFSYRTSESLPLITISLDVMDDGMLDLNQIKGRQNRPPDAQYRDDVCAFLNHLPTTMFDPSDGLEMGVTRLASGWRNVSEVTRAEDQLAVLERWSSLIAEMRLAPALQWRLAVTNPDALEGIAMLPAVAETLRVARTGSAPSQEF